MARVKVKLADNISRVVFMETSATVGAQIGTDLRMPDGALATAAKLAAYISSSLPAATAAHHRLLQGLAVGDDHPQYTQWSQSETISGQWQFSLPVWAANGAAATPGLAFTSDPDTGLYRIGANQLGASEGGVQTMRLAFANPSASVSLTAVNGTSLQPMRSDAAPALAQDIAPTWTGQHTWTTELMAPDGTLATPGYRFASEPNGFYLPAADTISVGIAGDTEAAFFLRNALDAGRFTVVNKANSTDLALSVTHTGVAHRWRVLSNGTMLMANVVNLAAYTVATLPGGTVGDVAYVTDALAPAFLAPVAGGGAVTCKVFYNGTQWVVQ